MAAFTALFVLQAPLCALACLPSQPSAAAIEEANHGASPCHEQAPSSTPSEPSNSHDDCGCADSYTAVLASAEQAPANLPSLTALAPNFLTQELHTSFGWAAHAQPRDASLPPPDILLLKSTLLI